MSKEYLIAVPESHFKLASSILRDKKIPFRIPGYPNGKVEVVEQFPSKINTHDNMLEFA